MGKCAYKGKTNFDLGKFEHPKKVSSDLNLKERFLLIIIQSPFHKDLVIIFNSRLTLGKDIKVIDKNVNKIVIMLPKLPNQTPKTVFIKFLKRNQ